MRHFTLKVNRNIYFIVITAEIANKDSIERFKGKIMSTIMVNKTKENNESKVHYDN